MDEGVETVEYGDLHEFYSTVEGRRSNETQSQYVQTIKRLRNLLKLDDTVKLYDVDAKEILKVIHKDSFHANGKMKTKSSPEKYRNSLMNYYRKRNKPIPVEIETDLAGFIKGRGGEVATARLKGDLKATEGKDVLEYSTYRSIAAASMFDDYIDGHLFFLMLWNMSCRGDSTHNLHLSCIKWMNDATGVSPLTVVLDRIASLPTVSHAPPPAQSSSTATFEAATPALAPIVSQLDSLAASVAQLTAAVSALTAQPVPTTEVVPVVTPMQLRQAVTEDFPWPKHIPLRQIYMLWYEGLNWHGKLYPLSKIPAKNLHLNVRKYVSYAKTCVAAIDDHLRADFRYQANAEQDKLFKSACRQLALQLIACGHEATEEAIILKLICNDYASLYINDLKFLR